MKKTKKMKKWISFALIFCMLTALVPAYAEEAESFGTDWGRVTFCNKIA